MKRNDWGVLEKPYDMLRSETGITVDMSLDCADRYIYRRTSNITLGAVLAHLGEDVDWLLMTTFLAFDPVTLLPRIKHDNEMLFDLLPDALRQATRSGREVDAYWFLGHWTECVGAASENPRFDQCEALGGHLEDLLEYSWLFVAPKLGLSSEKWLAAAICQTRSLDQDAFIIRLGGVVTVRGQEGSVLRTLPRVSEAEVCWNELARLRARGMKAMENQTDSTRRKPCERAPPASAYLVRREGLPSGVRFFLAAPSGNSSHMMFSCRKISYLLPGTV